MRPSGEPRADGACHTALPGAVFAVVHLAGQRGLALAHAGVSDAGTASLSSLWTCTTRTRPPGGMRPPTAHRSTETTLQ